MYEPDTEQASRRWLAGTLTWEARLRVLRARADLMATGSWTIESRLGPEPLTAVSSPFRPAIAQWDEGLDRSA